MLLCAGHPALIGRHVPFAITEQAAVRWLEHMQAAIDSTPEIDPDSKKLMLNFLKYVISPSFPLHFCMILQQLCSSSCSPSSMCSTGAGVVSKNILPSWQYCTELPCRQHQVLVN
jgi:hypothetical protein